MFNKYFDEYEVGETWTSKGRTVTEADIVNFAGLSGDFYSLHMDKEYAENNSPFGQRIAHGMLVCSIASGLCAFEPGRVIAFYGIDKLRFTNPTFIGDTITVEITIQELTDRDDGMGIVTAKQKVKKQNGDVVGISTMKILMAKKQGVLS